MPRTEPARGMRDFLPEDVRRREYVIGVIKRVYERYGFEPLETPAVENLETLMGKYGDEGNQLIFKILKRGEHEASGQADLALRYDLTVPLARVVAQHQAKLPRLFKRYQIQPVWRADRPARGRFREFYQCDVDALGSTSPVVEAELCAAVSDALTELGFNDFVIRLNHRQLLTALLNARGRARRRCTATALVALDKLDKIGADGVGAGAGGARHRRRARRRRCCDVRDRRWRRATRARRAAFVGDDAAGSAALREPASDPASWPRARSAAGRMQRRPEPGARPVVLHRRDHGDQRRRPGRQPRRRRALRQPGRHVPRARTFRPAGFRSASSGSSSSWASAACFRRRWRRRRPTSWWRCSTRRAPRDAMRVAAALRAAGLRVLVYPDADKIGKQIKYADGRGIPFVALLGDDEIKAGTVTVKDLAAQTQQTYDQAAAGAAILEALKQRG